MSRGIDTCTCGHGRSVHSIVNLEEHARGSTDFGCRDCLCARFFPHPQPDSVKFVPEERERVRIGGGPECGTTLGELLNPKWRDLAQKFFPQVFDNEDWCKILDGKVDVRDAAITVTVNIQLKPTLEFIPIDFKVADDSRPPHLKPVNDTVLRDRVMRAAPESFVAEHASGRTLFEDTREFIPRRERHFVCGDVTIVLMSETVDGTADLTVALEPLSATQARARNYNERKVCPARDPKLGGNGGIHNWKELACLGLSQPYVCKDCGAKVNVSMVAFMVATSDKSRNETVNEFYAGSDRPEDT